MTVTRPRATESPPAPSESLWRNGDFLKFWLGETLSLLGGLLAGRIGAGTR
ncbi:hypothetical protein [Streptomyces qinzhouensis]|uniref:hypothetical protein n=1 Tax=Streptomyces qinzhouensis TaxID=2599401 RepID=UPI0016446377|nr:hypothetical protein [Streptomyces qinzhouensis]